MKRSSSALGVVLLGLALAGCPRTTLIGENVDAGPPSTLTATGRVCTSAPDPSSFPLKLVVLVDQSGFSCVTDPPGAQASVGLCDQVAVTPPGVSRPARVRALERLLGQLQGSPQVSVAVLPYDANVRGVWTASGANLAGPLQVRVDAMQADLGVLASDLQGALARAHALIAAEVEQAAPAVLARTRYRVVILSNGPPSPRCALNDALDRYADDVSPTGVWADTDGEACNLIDPSGATTLAGFVAGADRNQDGQLLNTVSRLRALQAERHVGEVRVDTRLLFNLDTFAACGAACERWFGQTVRWPGLTPAPSVGAWARVSAKSVLERLAERGGGTYAEAVSSAELAAFTLDSLELSSLAAENVQKALIPQALRSTAAGGAWVLDDDGDGLSNDAEARAGSDPSAPDTDGDGFDDHLEVTRAATAFDPLVRDLRGCDPVSPLTTHCVARDSDGDGLSQYAEAFLQTDPTLADSDRDGLPDGLEVRWGLDPRARLDRLADSDGDGVTDFDEVRGGSAPGEADPSFPRVQVQSTELAPSSDGRSCTDFTITGLPMLPVARAGPVPAGVNLFKVWFAEAPRGVPEDVGSWSAACFFARRDVTRDPPVLVPPTLSQSLSTTNFIALPDSAPARTESCAGTEALSP